MQISTKIQAKSVPWVSTLRPRVLETVMYNGGYYQNTTGKNSVPDTLLDYIFIGSISVSEMILFKNPANTIKNKLEVGDVVQRVVEGTKIEGIYNGPNENLLSSYTVYTSIEF